MVFEAKMVLAISLSLSVWLWVKLRAIYIIIEIKHKKGSEISYCPTSSMKTLGPRNISNVYDFIFQKFNIQKHKIKAPKI